MSLPANQMEDGTYKDQITGNTFTVKDGVISGTVGSSCVAVVYNPEPEKPTVSVTVGDADRNGEITINDATLVQKYLAELEQPRYIEVTGDSDGSGKVDITDVTLIQQYISEIYPPSVIGKTVKIEI